jgi:hypothetical protein
MSHNTWRKSSYSGEGDTCVELAASAGAIRLRESDYPDVVVTTSPEKLAALIRAIKAGEFDRIDA